MTNRYTVAASIAAALVIIGGAVGAAAQDSHEMRVGSTVNITTCIVPSLDDDDEFVLTNITDLPAHPPIAGKVIYWINDVDKVRPFVGKRIQFDATIKDVDRKEIEVKLTNGNGNRNGNLNGNANGAIVEIELVGNQVKTLPETIGISAANQTVEELDIPTTLVKLKLHDNITTVAESCPTAGMMTASAAALVTETETIVETERAAVTPAPEVEEEMPAPIPAPEVEAEAEVAVTTPAPIVETETERTELPRTASPLPLFGLIGFGSLVAAGALRIRRREHGV